MYTILIILQKRYLPLIFYSFINISIFSILSHSVFSSEVGQIIFVQKNKSERMKLEEHMGHAVGSLLPIQ